MMRICISSGHSTKCQGAVGLINEVAEATEVTDEVALCLEAAGAQVEKFHDTVSVTQNENLNRLVDWHNSHARDLDVSIHFNAFEPIAAGRGVEVLYVTQEMLARELAAAISDVSGLINRGAKKRTDLFWLNHTAAPAVLIEVAFVDSEEDVRLYQGYFGHICEAIAAVIVGEDIGLPPFEPVPPPDVAALFHVKGKCSHFGGPNDTTGVSDSEGLAFIHAVQDAPHLFLPEGTPGTVGKGLARRLNPHIHYVACRWNYDDTPKPSLLEGVALVRAATTGVELTAFPADWGPNENTGRVADLSPGLMSDLGISTDDEVEVIYPWQGD